MTYDENFIARMKDWAILGLYPPQIAERMNLEGTERQIFLCNILDPEHPLAKEYWKAKQHQEEDLDAALQSAASAGDPKALALAYDVADRRTYNKLAKELFGI